MPVPGDLSICWGCGGLAFFTSSMELRETTPPEDDALAADPDVTAAQAAIRESRTPSQANERRWAGAS